MKAATSQPIQAFHSFRGKKAQGRSQPIVVVGAGGHGCVVADALLAAGNPIAGFVDANVDLHGCHLLGLPVLGGDEYLCRLRPQSVALANGLGGSPRSEDDCAGLRERVQKRLETAGWRFVTVLHPSAVVSVYAQVAPTAQLLAGSVVQPGARIEGGCIINTRALVEHDCVIGQFAHVAPGAVICGTVRIGSRAHVGAGAVVRQNLVVGAGVLLAAGAVLVRNASAGRWAGVPARPLDPSED